MFVAPIINPFIQPEDYIVRGNSITADEIRAVYDDLSCGKDKGIPTSTLVLYNSQLKTISFDKGWEALQEDSYKYTIIGFCYGILP